MIYDSAQCFRVCSRNLNTTQAAPRLPGPWPHGNPWSITCLVYLAPSLCHSALIYSRGVVQNEWFVRVRRGWFTPGCDQRVLSPRRLPLMAWNWDQASSSSSSICSGSRKLGASFVGCFAPSATHLHFSATAVAPPIRMIRGKTSHQVAQRKQTRRVSFLVVFFYSTALHSGR